MKFDIYKVRDAMQRLGLLLFAAGLFSLVLDYGSPQASIGLALAGFLLAIASCLEKR